MIRQLNHSRHHSNRLSPRPPARGRGVPPCRAGETKGNLSPKSRFVGGCTNSDRSACVRYGVLMKKLQSSHHGLLRNGVNYSLAPSRPVLARFQLHLSRKHNVFMLALPTYYAKGIKQRCIAVGTKLHG